MSLKNTIDQFNQDQAERAKKTEEFRNDLQRKREEFKTEFKGKLQTTILPFLNNATKDLKSRGINIIVSNSKPLLTMSYDQCFVKIDIPKIRGLIEIHIIANSDHQKVFAETSYQTPFKKESEKEEWKLNDITDEYLDNALEIKFQKATGKIKH
jgi:hypothetical protein